MQKIWQQPFPSPQNNKTSVQMSAIAGLCVFGILFFLKPFGINELSISKAFIIGLQYAAVTMLFSLLCNAAIPYLFPQLFEEINWTVLKEIIFLTFLILIVASGNILFTALKANGAISAQLIIGMLKYTLIIGIIPIVISVLIKQQQLLKKYRTEATEIETLIAEKKADENTTKEIFTYPEEIEIENEKEIGDNLPVLLQLSGANQHETLSLNAADFLFAQSSDNYTIIHYLQNALAQKVLYRTTIKNVESQTIQAPEIFRCHKSYLVNLSQVTHITGNAQGYKLHLGQHQFEIPVSRSLNATIKEKFATLQQA